MAWHCATKSVVTVCLLSVIGGCHWQPFADAVEFRDSVDVTKIRRQARGQVRGSQFLKVQADKANLNNALPDEQHRSRKLANKGCFTKLSEGRGGAGGATKCDSEGDAGRGGGGPQIATSCDEMTARHRLLGDGEARVANNFGGDIIDPPCDRNYWGRGTWWSYIGTGERVLVSTCHAGTNISTALFLYESDNLSCGDMTCLARSNLNQCGTGGMDAFFADSNMVYFVTILGDNGDNRNILGPEGQMAISFTRQTNGCDNFVPSLSARGELVNATIDENSALLGPQCSSNLHGRGLWYQFDGAGENMLISTCHNESSIPTAISIYESETDTCSDLTCKDFVPTSQSCLGVDGKSKGTVLRVSTAENRRYYMSIVGDNENLGNIYPSGPEGTVGITMVREFNGCDRDLALPIQHDGTVWTQSVMGSQGAPLLGPQCEQNHNGHGRWYQFTGKGEPTLISTCHATTTIPTVVSVYESADGTTCPGSVCQAFDDSNSCENGHGSIVLLPNPTKGATHYLSVLGSNGNVWYPPGPEGDIGVNVVTRSTGCDQGTIALDDGTVSILDNADEELMGPQCGMQYNGKGFWYEYVGKGRDVVASTCHPNTTIPTVISVYEATDGTCGSGLFCDGMAATNDCASGNGSTLRFFAKAGVVYKISVVGNNGNTLLPGPEGTIAFSLQRDVTCPCWSATELAAATPQTVPNGYLSQACNTLTLPGGMGSVLVTTSDGLGASITTAGGADPRTECTLQGEINRTIPSLNLPDEIETCLELLYDRCKELSSNSTIPSNFAERCTTQQFSDTIFLSKSRGGYGDCLNITTDAPTPSPSEGPTAETASPTVSCPCWTSVELAMDTPPTLDFTEGSCNTEIEGDLSVAAYPVNRASIRLVDGVGLGARIVRLGANEDQTICTMAGAITRSVTDLDADQTQACLLLLYDRCAFLASQGLISVTFRNQCTIDDFENAILVSEDGSDYDNCLGLPSN